MSALNYREYFGARLEISLAKPPVDKKKKEIYTRASGFGLNKKRKN